MSEANFEAVSKFISENREKHDKQLKAFCVTTEVCPIQEFLRGYDDEIKTIDASNNGETSTSCSISSFRDTFQAFDKYSPNLQKPKKQVSKDLNRTLSTNRSQSSSQTDLTVNADKWEKGPNATALYKSYRKLMKMIKEFQELSKDGLELKYVEALQKIHNLAKNIEKLEVGRFQNADIAFNLEDAKTLETFVGNVEKALFVDENQNLFKNFYDNDQSSINVSNVIELLDYCFEKIGHFREN